MSGKLIDPTEALASELIQTKITVSENQRQMRVMARTEVELRDLLEQRERSRARDPVREICICYTCWWYSLCTFQYRSLYENTCSYNFDC